MIDPTTEKLLSLPAAAKLIGLSVDAVRAWAGRGELETVTLGRRRYTSVEALRRQALKGQGPSKEKAPPPPSKESSLEVLRRLGVAR